MASYTLKYYKELQHFGHAVRLNIYEKRKSTDQKNAKKIGAVVQALDYGIQGRDGDFAPAIQKTSLRLVLIDAPERNTDDEKWGGWDEFYTSDATKYKVDLKIDGVLEWSGYITPDSYEEDLMYHSAINLPQLSLAVMLIAE